jgi:hypothetical protein
MKVGDLVNYQGWKAIIAEVDPAAAMQLCGILCFLLAKPLISLERQMEGFFTPAFSIGNLKY